MFIEVINKSGMANLHQNMRHKSSGVEDSGKMEKAWDCEECWNKYVISIVRYNEPISI